MSNNFKFAVISPTTLQVGEYGVKLQIASRNALVKILGLYLHAHGDDKTTPTLLYNKVKVLKQISDLGNIQQVVDDDLRVLLLDCTNTWYDISKNKRQMGSLVIDETESSQASKKNVTASYEIKDREEVNVMIQHTGALSLATTTTGGQELQVKLDQLKSLIDKLKETVDSCNNGDDPVANGACVTTAVRNLSTS